MKIVHVASEMAPIAKVGGLGDVVHGLAKQLAREGHDVEIILPKYDCLHLEWLSELQIQQRSLCVVEGAHRYDNTVWSALVDGLKVIFIEAHHPSYYFSRGAIYGFSDDVDRFAYFSRAAVNYLKEKEPDIIHIHDWQTAPIAPLCKEIGGFGKIVLTVHSLGHQGQCLPLVLQRIGLHNTLPLMQDSHTPTLANFLKGGIVYADALTTVSPNYEKEIKTPEGGCGLHTVLCAQQNKLKGILNGIDTDFWNPEKDPYLVALYNDKTVTSGKKENRRHLSRHLGLKELDVPLVAVVTRLVFQKGLHLIKHGLLRTLEKGGQCVLLGSSATPEVAAEFLELNKHPNCAICIDKDEALAHLIFAAADLFLIPSLFEPCGLTQLIALRYGTVPIARMTGGLVDTVFDVDTSERPEALRNGFTFDFPDKQGVNWALDRALACWQDKKRFQQLIQHGMQLDLSWKRAAQEYLSVYRAQQSALDVPAVGVDVLEPRKNCVDGGSNHRVKTRRAQEIQSNHSQRVGNHQNNDKKGNNGLKHGFDFST